MTTQHTPQLGMKASDFIARCDMTEKQLDAIADLGQLRGSHDRLLEACRVLVQELVDSQCSPADVALSSSPGMDLARAAIAKAQGGTNP